MKKTKPLSLSVMALLLAACSATTDKTKTKMAKGNIVNSAGEITHICEMDTSTGTRVGKRVCRSVEAMEDERKRSQEALRRQQAGVIEPTNN